MGGGAGPRDCMADKPSDKPQECDRKAPTLMLKLIMAHVHNCEEENRETVSQPQYTIVLYVQLNVQGNTWRLSCSAGLAGYARGSCSTMVQLRPSFE